jgi:hypothetical protein
MSATLSPVELPGGVLGPTGACHRTVWVRELTGRDEEVLADRGYATGAAQVTDLLAQAVVRVDGLDAPVDRALVADMLVGDRDYLVLRLRQLASGDAVHQVVRCPEPACARKVDVEFLISELPVRRLDALAPRYVVPLSRPALAGDARSAECVLRLPTGRDHEAVGKLGDANPARANTVLFGRLIERLGHAAPVGEETVRDLPLAVRQELADWLRANAPGPDLRVEVECPHCGGSIAYAFDLASFFFSEWGVRLETLYRQVHHLAFHYHWSERAILALPRAKRERYLALLLESLDGAGATA